MSRSHCVVVIGFYRPFDLFGTLISAVQHRADQPQYNPAESSANHFSEYKLAVRHQSEAKVAQ